MTLCLSALVLSALLGGPSSVPATGTAVLVLPPAPAVTVVRPPASAVTLVPLPVVAPLPLTTSASAPGASTALPRWLLGQEPRPSGLATLLLPMGLTSRSAARAVPPAVSAIGLGEW